MCSKARAVKQMEGRRGRCTKHRFIRSTPSFSRPAKPNLPPSTDAEDGRASIIFPFCPVRVAEDHREDPESGGGPCEQEEGDGEERRQQEDCDQTADRVGRTRSRTRWPIEIVVYGRWRGGPMRRLSHPHQAFVDMQLGHQEVTELGAKGRRAEVRDAGTETERRDEDDEEQAEQRIDACHEREDRDGGGQPQLDGGHGR